MEMNISKICITPNMSIREALNVLNCGHERIVLVVNQERVLLGVVADSDVRRAMLKGISLDVPVDQIMVKDPIVARGGLEEEELLALMRKMNRYEIPLIDENRKVVGLKTIDSCVFSEVANDVVIMAGGEGVRLLPLTRTIPKPLVEVGGKPIIFRLLDQLLKEGFQKITIALHYMAKQIQEAVMSVDTYHKHVRFVVESKKLGTAGALSLLETAPTKPFVVLNSDLLTKINLKAMLQYHELEGNKVTMAAKEETQRLPYGVIQLKDMSVLSVEEKPIRNYFVNSGIYVMDPSVLSYLPSGEHSDMTDLINRLASDGHRIGLFPIHEYWLDVGGHQELMKANLDVEFISKNSETTHAID